MRRAVLLVVVLLAVAGCGSGGGSDSDAAAAQRMMGPTTASATTPAAPYDVYTQKVDARGLTPAIHADEAVSVAGNTCDNTVTDMRGLIQSLRTIYPEPTQMAEFVTDRAVFIDAYCPSARPVFDAATQAELGYVAPVR